MEDQPKKTLARSSKMVLVLLPLLLFAIIIIWPVLPGRQRSNPQAGGPIGGEVHGTIYALIRGDKKLQSNPSIFLPDITVYLKDAQTSVTSPEVTTDLDGAFSIPQQPQAHYVLCWKAPGFAAGCSTPAFVLRGVNITLKPTGISPQTSTVYGRAALKDGTSCRFLATFLGANIFTRVSADTASGTQTVRANSYGEYVLAGLPPGNAKLTATCEDAKVSTARTLTGGFLRDDLTLPNVRPKALAYATVGGSAVGSVAPGTDVQAIVEAKDGGDYSLHYRWYVDPPVSGFVSVDSPTIDWKVPGPGTATAYVWAGDGHGGNVLTRIPLSTSPDKIIFSGHVTGDDAPLLADANVTINGIAGTTNAAGDFILTLPKEEPRYVVTITKLGYQMLSRAIYKPVAGGTYELFRAQDFVVDPTKPVVVTEKPPKGRDQTGIQILIDADSLASGADGRGAMAAAPLHVRALTYDMHNPQNQLPGDYGGVDKTGKAYRLSTFGSANVDIQDAVGHSFNLAPGKTATIKMSIDPSLLAAAPATIPVWHYETKRGLWVKDGTANRVGNVYQASVTHFSAVNMDLAFTNAACTRIVVDTGIMPVPFKIRMTPLSGPAVAADHQDQVISDALNVVVREPPNIDVRFDMVDSAGNIIAEARQKINTGAASASGVQWDPPPNPPYADCSSEVRYNEQTVQALFPVPPGFLTFRTPSNYLDPAQAPGLAADYYAKIDPGGTKTNAGDTNDFNHWKTINGFDRAGVTNATYSNQYDLGFGRDMYMQTGGQDGTCTNCIAYYVTNYTDADHAASGSGAIATVAMEFSPRNGTTGTPYTKFYVYHTDGTIANSADLDGNGQKFVPTLCIICHNGNISSMDSTTGTLPFARFIGFDLQSFAYAVAKPRPPQEPFFKTLNSGIFNHTNVSAPLKLLIENWYGTENDIGLPNPTFNDAAVPTAWITPTDESHLYNAVVKTSCRSCHTTRDATDTGVDISWASYHSMKVDGAVVKSFTCTTGNQRLMPQAQRTFARFWLSTNPNAPNTLASSHLDTFPINHCK